MSCGRNGLCRVHGCAAAQGHGHARALREISASHQMNCAQLAREFTNSRDLDERLFRLYQVVLHATVPSAAPLGLRKPIATAGGDVSRFPPRFDRIFSGETLTPVFGDLDAGIFAVFT